MCPFIIETLFIVKTSLNSEIYGAPGFSTHFSHFELKLLIALY